jgi:N6-L-threonylcarbamoyladenine synthase
MTGTGARLILGIETSCDETAAAVVADGRVIVSNVIASQVELHARYGGVFPEMASRQHVRDIVPVVELALSEAGAAWDDLSALAVTYGPGLSGSLLVGVNAAKGIALGRSLPLVGVNHIEGHLYSNWLHDDVGRGDPVFPHLALIVSGGHTDLVFVRDHGDYDVLGSTLDDAAGEAFDKVARLLGLRYPGGPEIETLARDGDPEAYELPVASTDSAYDFSFSGLKTAVLRLCQRRGFDAAAVAAGEAQLDEGFVADVAASFQAAVVTALVGRVQRAARDLPAAEVLVAGGVSANHALREAISSAVGVPSRFPPLILCTDNAAMIAAAGHFASARGRRDGLDLDVVPGLRLGGRHSTRLVGRDL